MTSPISSANAAPSPVPVAKAAAKPAPKADETRETTHIDAGKTKVTISSAATAAVAAEKEAMETPAQTAQEAQGNDMQAKRLLAKEQMAEKLAKG